MTLRDKLHINRHLFYETSHSPSLFDIVGEEMIEKITDFCFIANPYYPNNELIKKLQERLPILIKSYPSSNPSISQKHLSDVLHINPNHIIIGNGATELITIIQKECIDDFAIPVPTFSEYTEKIRKQEQAKLYYLQAHNNYQLNLREFADWIVANSITSALIINPGNPTGQLHSLDEMKDFLNSMRHLRMVIVDESFIDFAGEELPSLLPCIQQYQNLVVVRSMSKHCGIPGLRLGYCVTANSDLLQKIRSSIPVWNINTIAEYFLTQLYPTDELYHVARKQVIADVHYLYTELKQITGFFVYPTGSNFVLIRIECGVAAKDLQRLLLEDYYLYVRDCSNKIGLDNFHIRVASQGKDKDSLLIAALQQISNQYKKA
ncbi:MAG: Threonine-phosphate decarboxylase [Bacteroidetes bacterium ADurb.Bin217]|nr:MAG: Threonine-phosphate decarboxylase [Bacteroidetes bacterium ADurb.Bin217]